MPSLLPLPAVLPSIGKGQAPHHGWHQPRHLPSSALGLILLSYPAAQPQPDYNRTRRRNQTRESFEEHSCPSSISWDELCVSHWAALPHPTHTGDAGSRLEHPAPRQLCKVSAQGDFSGLPRFPAALQGAERGGFPSLRLLTWPGVTAGGGSAEGRCDGRCSQPELPIGKSRAGCGLGLCTRSILPCSWSLLLSPTSQSFLCWLQVGVPLLWPIPSPEAPPRAKGSRSQH